jgi:hypothetical protein
MLSGFDWLTNVIIAMDISSTISEISAPLYSIYALITINIYELAINVDGGKKCCAHKTGITMGMFQRDPHYNIHN